MKILLKLYFIFSFWITIIFSFPLEIDLELKSKTHTYFSSNYKVKAAIPSDLAVQKQDVLTMKTCLGSPPQCFSLVYDTGSFHLWVPSKDQIGCLNCKMFNNTLSKTLREHINNNPELVVQYIMGNAWGHLATDQVTIAGVDKNMTIDFMLANVINFDVNGADGIIGFGRNFETKRHTKPYRTKKNSIMEVLMENGLANRKVFSQKYTNEDKTEVKLFLGDFHEDFLNTIDYKSCKVLPFDPLFARTKVKDLWTCRMSHVIFGENDADNFDRNAYALYSRAVLDSGTNYIMAPESDLFPFRNYFENISACQKEKDFFKGVTIFLCDLDFDVTSLPKISLVLNGAAYYIPPEHLFSNFTEIGLEKNVFNIFFFDRLESWFLGQAFMKNYHVLFDHEENSVSFKALDSKFVSDVSSKTTDSDFVFGDYYRPLLYLLLLSIFVIITVGIYIRYTNKKRREKEFEINNDFGLLMQ